MNEKGLLIVFSGPSGAGKDTVLRELMKVNTGIKLSVSATTRQPRKGETDGKDYFFLERETFLSMVQQGDMLEHAEYCGNFYGTPSKPIRQWMDSGSDVILEIEVQGGAQIKEKCPDSISIFLSPPSLKELELRLRFRNTDSEEAILKRLEKAKDEILQAKNYDYIVINDTIEHAVEQINTIITAEKLRLSRVTSIIERVLESC